MSARNLPAWSWRKDWVLAAQLGCALVVTFHAEYTLALAAGVNEYVALAVPGALDLYVIRALQKHRDVFLAVLVMVAANVASHLVTAGLIPVGWAVYSAVGGTVPLLLWRGHSLRHTRTRAELLWGFLPWRPGTPVPEPSEYTGTGASAVKALVPEGVPAVPAPGCPWGHDECAGHDGCAVYSSAVPEDVPEQVNGPCGTRPPFGARLTDPCPECGYGYAVHPLSPPVPSALDRRPLKAPPEEVPAEDDALMRLAKALLHPDVPAPAPVLGDGYHMDGCDGFCLGTGPAACARRAAALDVPDHVPAEWVQPGTPDAYPPLTAVPDPPDVPAEYAPDAVHSPVLVDSDWAYLDRASEYVHGCKDLNRKPSVRGMRSALKIGQDRAERLLEHLGVEP